MNWRPLSTIALLLPVVGGAQRTDTTVRNAGAPTHKATASLVREIRIGSLDGPEHYVFGEVSELAVARDGSIYVYDRQAPALRKYDATGKFVKTFGAKGQGPGEYLNVGGLAILADGRVLLWDTQNWRINVYSPDGNVLDHWPTVSGIGSGSGSLSTGRSLTVDTAGNAYVKRRLFGPRTPGMRPLQTQVWIRYDRSGKVADTIHMPTFSTESQSISATGAGGNTMSSMELPFSANAITVLSPSGSIVTGLPSTYAFEFGPPNGTSVVSVRRSDVVAQPVTARERDSVRALVTSHLRQTDPNWTWTGPDIPKTKPFYQDIVTGDDGRIWIAVVKEVAPRIGAISSNRPVGVGQRGAPPPAPRPQTEQPRPKLPALYDVFESNGTYVGRVEVPPGVSTAVRRGDYVWGLTYDDDDVQYVTRFRIRWN